ncbi:hypothetical protein F4781DRAFT_168465 [Annulohypoxylon bovei var. microspora]|nr:hypothetical protein F4781DRAFT_168465 [Annulohypoxylon bovei var. microspora]
MLNLLSSLWGGFAFIYLCKQIHTASRISRLPDHQIPYDTSSSVYSDIVLGTVRHLPIHCHPGNSLSSTGDAG